MNERSAGRGMTGSRRPEARANAGSGVCCSAAFAGRASRFGLGQGLDVGRGCHTATWKRTNLNRSERFPPAALRLLRKAERLGQDKGANTPGDFYRPGQPLPVRHSVDCLTETSFLPKHSLLGPSSGRS